MIIYAVLPETDSPALDGRIFELFQGNCRKIGVGQWLIAANLTVQGVTELIGVDKGTYGRTVVVGVESYYGWHLKDVWDWIALKRGQP
ncbi:hypothetical protein [Mesorhizobium loti]|uniref:SinR family protein n=1 Tax=Mesorhizobium loti R88b TaxID=935548 RepID=A0A6M7WNK0_RHILI|nr:hypothetical protein [Mesorhizobium loti]QKD01474.1 hypothetical protein EB235_08090 [Mesorhizobium loti R88b]